MGTDGYRAQLRSRHVYGEEKVWWCCESTHIMLRTAVSCAVGSLRRETRVAMRTDIVHLSYEVGWASSLAGDSQSDDNK